MAKRKAPSDAKAPAGAQPQRKDDAEDRRLREEAQQDTGSETPMDPEDEEFIKSK